MKHSLLASAVVTAILTLTPLATMAHSRILSSHTQQPASGLGIIPPGGQGDI